jgi:hypothetical protein
MELVQHTAASFELAPISYDFFFKNLDYNLSKGRGISLFEADKNAITSFTDQAALQGCSPLTFRLSSLGDAAPELPGPQNFAVIIQDLPFPDFLDRAALIADKLIFPLWFKRTSMCFFSAHGRGVYDVLSLGGNELHSGYTKVINSLLCEQIFVLLERVNYKFSSPVFLELPEHKTIFTPIEEKMLQALEENGLSYQPQVRLGRYTVDFLVEHKSKLPPP